MNPNPNSLDIHAPVIRRLADLMRTYYPDDPISRPVEGSRPAPPSRPSTSARPGATSGHSSTPVQSTATPGPWHRAATPSADMPSTAYSTPPKRGASNNITNLHKHKPYALPSNTVNNSYHGASSPIKRPVQTPPSVDMRGLERIPDEFIYYTNHSRPHLSFCVPLHMCLIYALDGRSIPKKSSDKVQYDAPVDLRTSIRPIPISREICARYVSFIDRRATSPTALTGVSLSRLLTSPDVSIEGANDLSEDLGLPPRLELMVRLNGFPPESVSFPTVCNHGSVTRHGLAFMLARRIFDHMQRETYKIVHQGLQMLPIPARFEELRIIALYKKTGSPWFEVDLLYVKRY